MALGANMAPKSFQNGARGGVESAPCFWAWRVLGGVLGPLGAQELILIDFWLIFDGFWLIFDGFLDDFSMIFDRFLMSPSAVAGC